MMIRKRSSLVGAVLLVASGISVTACSEQAVPGLSGDEAALAAKGNPGSGGFEVWILDQSGTRARPAPPAGTPADFGGWLHVFEGSDLMGNAANRARPIASVDLGGEVAELCIAETGREPIRPHMIAFNVGHTHGMIAFVASGHVAIVETETRRAIRCIETDVSPSTGTRQAHAAFPAPDGSYILVANQNGKRLERIDANFAANSFVRNDAAALDLAGSCVTPNGDPCEDDLLRPINWPICPVIASDSRHVFVTLRGGGLFVVDAKQTPMRIVAEYDLDVVNGNGCGGVEAGGYMFVNSGGSPVGLDHGDHRKFGFDVYRFPLDGYSETNPRNFPAPDLILSKDGESDSHGMVATRDGRYLWVMDRLENVVEVIDIRAGRHVNTIGIAGAVSDDPTPDIADIAPSGNRIFAALRGPVPLSGDPHNAIGSTPGLGVFQVTQGGRSGSLMAVARLENPLRIGAQAPDPHGLQVRLRR